MKTLSFYIAFLLPSLMWAQFSPQNVDLIREYSQTITGEDFYAHLSFLADDLLEGRETGQRGQKLASLYIRSQFMRMGLRPGNSRENSYFQQYYLGTSEVESMEIAINDSTYEYLQDFFGLKGQVPETMDEPWEFVGYGIQEQDYNNLEGKNLSGKTALMFAGSPTGPSEKDLGELLDEWTSRAEGLYKTGAKNVVMVIPNQPFNILSRYSLMAPQVVTDAKEIPYGLICISQAMGDYILSLTAKKPEKMWEKLQKKAKVPELDFSSFAWNYTASVNREYLSAENVLGYLEGTDKKEELLILTAHYDHIGIVNGQINNGADDDGSGTSAILELAEAFAEAAKNGIRPRRSILFMTVSGEEKGLLGSEFYANHPIYSLDQTIANLNIDMIGRIDEKYAQRADSTNYVYLIGSDKLSSELHAISEASNDQFSQLTLDYTYNDEEDPNRFYYRSDHYNFAKNGIPVIFYFTGVHEDYHRPTDDYPKIRLDKTAKITQLVFATAWELANREDRIKVDANKP